MLKFYWEVRDLVSGFTHRIVATDEEGTVVKEGLWATYRGVATLELYQQTYIAVTEYHKGELPVNCVLKIETVSTEMR